MAESGIGVGLFRDRNRRRGRRGNANGEEGQLIFLCRN